MNSFLNINLITEWVLLIAVQVLVLNGIDYLQLGTPFLFILFIIDLPTDMNRITLLLTAFATGLVVDIFSSTPGIHSTACVLIAYLKRWISKALGPSDISSLTPSFQTFGRSRYLQYAAAMVTIHRTLFYFLESGSLNQAGQTTVKTIESVLITMLLIFSVEYFKYRHSKNE